MKKQVSTTTVGMLDNAGFPRCTCQTDRQVIGIGFLTAESEATKTILYCDRETRFDPSGKAVVTGGWQSKRFFKSQFTSFSMLS